MEAKELMIGDIVMATAYCEYEDGDGYTKFPVRIDGIFKYNNIDINEWNISASPIQEGVDYESYDDFEPIPLTAEILGLNGFEIFKGRYGINRYRIIDNDMVVIVEPMKIESRLGNSWFWVTLNHRSDVVQPNMTYPLTDVYVFQHLLRLCGLNELADNFKVEKGE